MRRISICFLLILGLISTSFAENGYIQRHNMSTAGLSASLPVFTDSNKNLTSKSVADTLTALGLTNAVVFKGAIDCSGNPNYPAADAGDAYVVSVDGKIGGASGINVITGDTIICKTDGSAAGTQAAVGANWNIIEQNIDLSNIIISGGTASSMTSVGTTTLKADHIQENTGSHGVVFDNNVTVTGVTTFDNTAKLKKGADFTGATVDLSTATGNVLDITTDTTAISSFGTVTAGTIFYVRFMSARDITYNATSMITPGARTITTTAGDTAILESLGSGNWLIFHYRKADGRLLGDVQVVTVASTRNITVNEMTGQTLLVTGAYTPSMPSAVVGRKGKFMATTATVYSIDLQTGTDVIYHNGTALPAGNKITSDGTIRNTISCECNVTGIYECNSVLGLATDGG